MKLSVYTENGNLKVQAAGDSEVILAWTGEYGRGDTLSVEDLEPGSFYQFRADESIPETLIYVTQASFAWQIPFYAEKARYAPLSFAGTRHYASIRRAEPSEISAFRNLALDPADQHDLSGVYPHVHANAETRGNASFFAQNVIDGYKACLTHGEWPFQSWGTDRREDAAITLEFGHPVDTEYLVLYLRADFPHDAWWDAVTAVCSDGSREQFHPVRPIGTGQRFAFQRKNIYWLRLEDPHRHDDSSPFPSLTQLEVYGTVSREK